MTDIERLLASAQKTAEEGRKILGPKIDSDQMELGFRVTLLEELLKEEDPQISTIRLASQRVRESINAQKLKLSPEAVRLARQLRTLNR